MSEAARLRDWCTTRPGAGGVLPLALVAVLLGLAGASPGWAMERCTDTAHVAYAEPLDDPAGPVLETPTQVSLGVGCDGATVVLRYLDAAGGPLGGDWTGVVVDGRAQLVPAEPSQIRVAQVEGVQVELRYPEPGGVLGLHHERGGGIDGPALERPGAVGGVAVPVTGPLPRTGTEPALLVVVAILAMALGAAALRARRDACR